MSTFVMSGKYPHFFKIIEGFGNKIILSDKVEDFNNPEHAI